jgi:proteasome assembly chaperone (PAC2) family protein
VITVERWPECHEPVLVLALAGWVDAGVAGAGTISALHEQMGADEFAHIDLTDLLDLQQTRPTARFEAGGLRVIEWPRITFEVGRAGRDVVLVHGPEPSLSWPSVASTITEAAARLGAREAVTLGGMPALVSHRRPLPVLATATSRSLAQELAPLRADYMGPTGLQTVVQRTLGENGVRCAGLWAQVPQYVSGSPSPPAVRALLRRLVELYRLDLDLGPLDARCRAYTDRVEEGLAARPDVKEIVDRIDREQVRNDDDLVSEIEHFLRSQSDPE